MYDDPGAGGAYGQPYGAGDGGGFAAPDDGGLYDEPAFYAPQNTAENPMYASNENIAAEEATVGEGGYLDVAPDGDGEDDEAEEDDEEDDEEDADDGEEVRSSALQTRDIIFIAANVFLALISPLQLKNAHACFSIRCDGFDRSHPMHPAPACRTRRKTRRKMRMTRFVI